MSSSGRGARSWLVAALVLPTLVACAGTGDPDTSSGPLPNGVASRGEALYGSNCAACHGVDLRGTDDGPSHLDPVYEPGHHGDLAFLLAVRRGVRPHHWDFGPMPAIEGLTEQEVADIIAYVREQQQAVGLD